MHYIQKVTNLQKKSPDFNLIEIMWLLIHHKTSKTIFDLFNQKCIFFQKKPIMGQYKACLFSVYLQVDSESEDTIEKHHKMTLQKVSTLCHLETNCYILLVYLFIVQDWYLLLSFSNKNMPNFCDRIPFLVIY